MLPFLFSLKGVAIAAAIAFAAGAWSGYAFRDSLCDAAMLRVQLATEKAKAEKLALELAASNELHKAAQETIKQLGQQDADARDKIVTLEFELAKAEKEKADAKPSPNALVDAACRWTGRGVQFFTRRR